MTGQEQGRRDELAVALARVHGRIAAACAAAGRDAAQVRLLPVTKTFPARDVSLLVDLGLLDAAEARDSEAATKAAEVASLRPVAAVRWHMVGRLQRNKCRSVARWAAQVQSVARKYLDPQAYTLVTLLQEADQLIIFLNQRAEHDDRRLRRRAIAPHRANELVAIQPWHAHVYHDAIWRDFKKAFQASRAIRRHDDAIATKHRQAFRYEGIQS